MKLSDLLIMSRLYTSGAKRTVVPDTQLKIIVNAGAVDVATIGKCMFRTKNFDITASKGEYSITDDIADDYVAMADSGVWLYDGSQYKEIDEKNRKYLDDRYVNWRSMDDAFPIIYYVDNDVLGFFRVPDTTRAAGGQINYYRKCEPMVSDDDQPFHIVGNKTKAIGSLETLSDSVLDYVRWKLCEPLSKSTEEVLSRQKEYYAALGGRMKIIKEKKALNANRYAKRRMRVKK